MHRPMLFVVMITALCAIVIQQRLASQTQRQIPVLQVDPYWPQLPENLIIGVGAGVATDAENNVWIIHRPGTVTEKRACCKAAPAVMEFSPSGKLLQSWSGAGEGHEWPLENDEHGIFVDYKNNVWIAGRGTAFASVPVTCKKPIPPRKCALSPNDDSVSRLQRTPPQQTSDSPPADRREIFRRRNRYIDCSQLKCRQLAKYLCRPAVIIQQ